MRLFSGQRAFVLQRLSALVLLAVISATAVRLALSAPPSLEQWQAWAAQPLGAAVLLVSGTALFAHAWVGVRDVVLDYVHPLPLRLGVLALAATGLFLLAAWMALIVVRHAL